MTFAGEVFGKQHVAGTKAAFSAAATDLHRAEKRNHELALRGAMKFLRAAERVLAK